MKCCSDSADKVRKIMVGNTVVGIANFDGIIEEVRRKNINDEEVADELLRLTKIYNYVPSSAEEEYKEALLREWREKYVKDR